MDRIIVRTNADMQRAIDWGAELIGLAIELPFREGEIEFQEEELLLRFAELEKPNVRFTLSMGKNGGKPGDWDWIETVDWSCNLETADFFDLNLRARGTKGMMVGNLLIKDDTLGKCFRKFRALMLFAAYYREEVESSRVISRESAGGSKPGKRSNKRKLTIRRYTISSEMLSELPAPKRVWKGYSESFGVRGHYRHMKSGKVVWVRPFEKKGRKERKSDKEYIL